MHHIVLIGKRSIKIRTDQIMQATKQFIFAVDIPCMFISKQIVVVTFGDTHMFGT